MLVPDLEDFSDTNLEQWPAFAKEVAQVGVRAAFAFPLLLCTSSIGAFNL